MPSHHAKMPALGTRGVHVQKLSVASVLIAAVAFSVPVRAADMPPIPMAPIPIALPFDWEGFYVGVHTGTATSDVSFTQTNVSWSGFISPPTTNVSTSVNTGESATLRATNVIGGLQAGYSWVVPGPYLFGLEADISGTDISSTVLTSPRGDPSAVAQWNDKVNLFGSVRARLGYIAGPWLFYATGGFGWEYDKLTRTQLSAPFTFTPGLPAVFDPNALQGGSAVTASHLRAGWTAGAGVEWAFARTWSVKLEYLHFDTQSELLSSGHFNFVSPPTVAPVTPGNQLSSSVTAQTSNLTLDTVRIGLNHTFN
jgi:outer membrane immunogenic protein